MNFNMTCSTENVLYVLTCMGCSEYYVGQSNERKEQGAQTTSPAPRHC